MARLLTTDHTSQTVVTALKDMLGQINQMAIAPDRRVQTLTWDQGAEMAASGQLAEHFEGLKLYFCDPHSPCSGRVTRILMPSYADSFRKAPILPR
nr:hypothetical protein [Corynebacterium auriscanis]